MDCCDKCGGCTVEVQERDDQGDSCDCLKCLNCGKRLYGALPEPKHIPTQRGGQANNAGWFR